MKAKFEDTSTNRRKKLEAIQEWDRLGKFLKDLLYTFRD